MAAKDNDRVERGCYQGFHNSGCGWWSLFHNAALFVRLNNTQGLIAATCPSHQS
jgi:hypothetical protein